MNTSFVQAGSHFKSQETEDANEKQRGEENEWQRGREWGRGGGKKEENFCQD